MDEKEKLDALQNPQNIRVLDCGCWINTKTGKKIIFCLKHLLTQPPSVIDEYFEDHAKQRGKK